MHKTYRQTAIIEIINSSLQVIFMKKNRSYLGYLRKRIQVEMLLKISKAKDLFN